MTTFRFTALVAALGVATLLALPADATPVSAPTGTNPKTCGLEPTGGTVTRSLFPGSVRSYNLRVPAGLEGSATLLLSLHGLGSFPYGQEVATGWSPYADDKKFIVAYPAGTANKWDFAAGSPDVAFLERVVKHIAADYCIDRGRVYAEGGSNGSYMAQRLACDAADTFAAISATMGGDPSLFGTCAPSRPIGVSLFHGENDPLIPVSAGRRARDAWVERNDCDPTGVPEPVPNGEAISYHHCRDRVTVTWRSYAGLGHAYPAGADGADWRDRAWHHLTAHTLPS